jgi:DNA-binding GntR family transcriptional regulator
VNGHSLHGWRVADAAQGPSSVRARVTDALRAGIVTGELEAGQVYSAPRLGAQLGVSATPVREAMLDLLKDGLVRTVRNKGFEVLAPSPAALHDILEVRLLLEVPTVRRLAERGVREADLAALLALADETVRTAEEPDIVGHVAADLQFHLALLDLWGNDEITEAVRALRSRSRLAGLCPPRTARR